MEKNLRANVLQNLLQVVIRSDEDDNMTIEEDEIDDLVERIQKINGVEVVEDRFKAAIMNSGGSLSSVMDIIKNLMADDSGENGEDEIFIIKDRKSVVRWRVTKGIFISVPSAILFEIDCGEWNLQHLLHLTRQSIPHKFLFL